MYSSGSNILYLAAGFWLLVASFWASTPLSHRQLLAFGFWLMANG